MNYSAGSAATVALQYSIPLTANHNPARHRLGIQSIIALNDPLNCDTRWLVSAGRDGQLLAHKTALASRRHPATVVANSSHEGGDLLTLSTADFTAQPSSVVSMSLDQQSDWLNDLALINRGQQLLAASADGTISVYPTDSLFTPPCNAGAKFVIGTQRTCGSVGSCYNCGMKQNAAKTTAITSSPACYPVGHTDCIQRLANSNGGGWFASGGLDNKICVWDARDLRQFLQLTDKTEGGFSRSGSGISNTNGGITISSSSSSSGNSSSGNSGSERQDVEVYQPSLQFGEPLGTPKSSIYALTASQSGDFIVSGGADNLIKVWDARSGKKEACLAGHGDIVRSILLSDDGRTIVSAAADGLVKVWSMVTLKCLYSFGDFSDSVWSLASASASTAAVQTDYLNSFYAGGRDGLIMRYNNVGYVADVDVGRRQVGRFPDNQPASALAVDGENGDFVWSGSSGDSTIYGWTAASSPTAGAANDESLAAHSPLLRPAEKIPGDWGIIKHELLDNRRQAIVKRLDGSVEKWDLLRCHRELIYRSTKFDEVFETENRYAEWSPKWCLLDSRTGCLTVSLLESNWTDGEAYADELLASLSDGENYPQDQRINLGCWILDSLLRDWSATEKRRILESTIPLADNNTITTGFMNVNNGAVNVNNGAVNVNNDGAASAESINRVEMPKSGGGNSQPNSPVLTRLFSRLSWESSGSNKSSTRRNNNSPDNNKFVAPSRHSSIVESETVRRQSTKSQKSVISTEFEAPPIEIPSNTRFAITETVGDRYSPVTLISGFINAMNHSALLEYLPLWSYKFLIKRIVLPKPVQKLTFTVHPAPDCQLPSLPAGTERLSANRAIRVRKILAYVVDKLNLGASSSSPADGNQQAVCPEDWLELCYENQPLAPLTSLSTIRYRYSIGSAEVPLRYRMIIRERL